MRFAVVALLLILGLVNAANNVAAPLVRIISMLTDLREKVSTEGTTEAETYNKFACFCKDTMAAKNDEISDGETARDTLRAQLTEANSNRDQADASMADLEKELQKLGGEIEEKKAQRHDDRLVYAKSEVDLTQALQGLEAAIGALKAAKTAVGLVQLKKMAKTVRQAVAMAEALGIAHVKKQAAAALAQLASAPEVPDSIYEFHGDDIVSTLEGLKKEFLSKKTELTEEEAKAQAEFDKFVQEKEASIATSEKDLKKHQKSKADFTTSIAQGSQDLTVANAKLADDQGYLMELSKDCNEKAVLWDQRNQARANELTALTQAIDVLEGINSEDDDALLQLKSISRVPVAVPNRGLISQPATDNEPALVQLATRHRRVQLRGGKIAGEPVDWRSQAVELLKIRAGDSHSALLLRVAAEAAADPFGKVKQLIQELIERLLREAQEEASHKGWCDKEMALAVQARDTNADAIAEVNGNLEVGEARRAKLAEAIEDVDTEIATLNATLTKAKELRKKESAQNADAIKEAKRGRNGVAQAIDTLEKFYKSAANEAKKSLLQLKGKVGASSEPAPDAGFSTTYAGSQDAKEGVIGMLEVVKADFERSIKETQEAEAKAKQDLNELETTSGSSLAAKKEAKKATDKALAEANAEDEKERANLKTYQGLLDGALAELEALHAPCMGGGMTAEERKIQRQEEMDALQKVLCILDQHGVGSVESC